MADNYLERQYELYAARKAAWEKARKLGRKRKHAAPKPAAAEASGAAPASHSAGGSDEEPCG